ncbi:DUF192 domain-containing protein [Rubrobacter aplysinae]|uniref:DUF192 domain-containing protein n=1 Tax=Rubrobacter aplysinae TaxID=909625 RepID=UPI00069CDC51|nr:DUF192 domain-containing protein [Rubrobacter aplysinae]
MTRMTRLRPLRKLLLSALLLVLLSALVAGCGQGETDVGETASGSDGAGSAPLTRTVGAEEADLPDSISTGEIPQPPLQNRPVVIRSSGGEVRVRAEIADDDPERTRGLMAREELGENEGMLFVFDSERSLNFIMENTLLPLSIAYIDSRGSIVDIRRMQPLSEDTYPSAEPAMYALEVNQGFFSERGVEVGDEVDLPSTVVEG